MIPKDEETIQRILFKKAKSTNKQTKREKERKDHINRFIFFKSFCFQTGRDLNSYYASQSDRGYKNTFVYPNTSTNSSSDKYIYEIYDLNHFILPFDGYQYRVSH